MSKNLRTGNGNGLLDESRELIPSSIVFEGSSRQDNVLPSQQKNQEKTMTEKKSVAAVMSLKERLKAGLKKTPSASAVVKAVQEKKECRTDPQIVGDFARLMDEVAQVAVSILSLTMSVEEAEDQWFGSSWDDRLSLLRGWVAEEESIQGFLDQLEMFGEEVSLREFLIKVLNEVKTSADSVQTMEDLHYLLEGFRKGGMVNVVNGAGAPAEKAVVISNVDGDKSYLPKAGLELIEAGWIFVKEAEVRARHSWELMKSLIEQSDRWLNPLKVSNGMTGKLLVCFGPQEAVLLEFANAGNSGYIVVRLSNQEGKMFQVGLNQDQINQLYKEQEWDDKSHCIRDAGSDEWARISDFLADWAGEEIRMKVARSRERQRKFAPLTDIETMGTHFSNQALTRLLRGEEGVCGFWMDNFSWSDVEGAFGVAIERNSEGLFLRRVVSDHPFDQSLLDAPLPISVDEDLLVKVDHLPQMEKRAFQSRIKSLLMIKSLMILRIKGEKKYAPQN